MSDIGGTGGENDSESSLPTFRPFTREELAIIEKRIHDKAVAAKKRAEKRAKNIAVSNDGDIYGRRRLLKTNGAAVSVISFLSAD